MLSREQPNGDFKNVSLIRKGIAWESDKKYKFKNPEGDLQEGKGEPIASDDLAPRSLVIPSFKRHP